MKGPEVTETQGCWFIVETNPSSEKKAAAELRRAGIRAYLPRQAKEVRHKRTNQPLIKRRPLYTGYLFIRFPDHMIDRRGVPPFDTARKCQGVRQFLRFMNERDEWEPFPVSEWKPTPLAPTGSQRTRARWSRRGRR